MTQIITDNLQARTRPVPLCSPHKLSAPAPVCHDGLWWACSGCSLTVLCRSPQRGFDISVWLAKRLTLILAICASDASNLAVTFILESTLWDIPHWTYRCCRMLCSKTLQKSGGTAIPSSKEPFQQRGNQVGQEWFTPGKSILQDRSS